MTNIWRYLIRMGVAGLTLSIVVIMSLGGVGVSVDEGEGWLSFNARVAMAAEAGRYLGETTVTEMAWGFQYTLENGDIVEVGDSTTPDFKAHIKTTRWNGVADFSMWLEGGTFIPTLTDDEISFNFNSDIIVKIYPVAPSVRLPEGGIEYDITLTNRPAQNKVTFGVDWNGITWSKLLALDVEYDQAACEEEWGIEHAPFTITPTTISSGTTSEVLKTRAEYEINSYIGEAIDNWHETSVLSPTGVSYSTVSRSYLYIHRGLMTDALNDTAWVEDMELDEVGKTIEFTLPKTWLRNAAYPLSQVCGVDPAYTEDWASFGTGITEVAWTDYDIFTNDGIPKSAVVEIIITNDDAGKEYIGGIRADGSGLNSRYFYIAEAEGGGAGTVRMFTTVHVTTGLIEVYTQENTDIIFNIAGYWENVGFTDTMYWDSVGTSGAWTEVTLSHTGSNDRVCAVVHRMEHETAANLVGVRNTSSSLNRYILAHEVESGGHNHYSMLVKADANDKVEVYNGDHTEAEMAFIGFFGSEMDFVESFQNFGSLTQNAWTTYDLTAYLDQDGRICDFLLMHNSIGSAELLGIRDGDDTTTNRYLLEHEAEDNGSSTGEYTGFGITAKSNSIGKVYYYADNAGTCKFYLMGYFKPVGGVAPDISNTPGSKNFGILQPSSTNWSDGAEPSWPLVDADAFFTVTNNSGAAVDISITAINFTGGVGWTLTGGSPGSNTVRMTVFEEGDGSGDGLVVTTSPQAFIASLADAADKDWEMKLETGTFTDGAAKQSTVTLTAALSIVITLHALGRRNWLQRMLWGRRN